MAGRHKTILPDVMKQADALTREIQANTINSPKGRVAFEGLMSLVDVTTSKYPGTIHVLVARIKKNMRQPEDYEKLHFLLRESLNTMDNRQHSALLKEKGPTNTMDAVEKTIETEQGNNWEWKQGRSYPHDA